MGQVNPVDINWRSAVKNDRGDYLVYTGCETQSAYCYLNLLDKYYKIDIIDVWEMKIKTLSGTYSGKSKIDLPGHPYIALRARKIKK